VQLLTKCSIGNGWLKILDWGKLAITLYDIHTREAMRVSLDYSKLDRYPRVQAWASNSKSKQDNPLEPLIDEIMEGGRDLLIYRKGTVGIVTGQVAPYGGRRICSKCGEVFRHGLDTVCQGCLEPFLSWMMVNSTGER
jgi:formylmethanofuran dehydrogenase subunit E